MITLDSGTKVPLGSVFDRALKGAITDSVLNKQEFDTSFLGRLGSDGINLFASEVAKSFKDNSLTVKETAAALNRAEDDLDVFIQKEKKLVDDINGLDLNDQYNTITTLSSTLESDYNYYKSLYDSVVNYETKMNLYADAANFWNSHAGAVERDINKWVFNPNLRVENEKLVSVVTYGNVQIVQEYRAGVRGGTVPYGIFEYRDANSVPISGKYDSMASAASAIQPNYNSLKS